jgi:hypothetical protein
LLFWSKSLTLESEGLLALSGLSLADPDRLLALTSGLASTPEIMHMLGVSLSDLLQQDKLPHLELRGMSETILSKTRRLSAEAVSKRVPLIHAGKSKAAVAKVGSG